MQLVCTLWGTRGSRPVSGPRHLHYGGATTCVTFQAGDHIFMVDAGTGASSAARALGGPAARWNVLFTHHHHDHIQGMPFFPPLYGGRHPIQLWGPRPEADVGALRAQMAAPFFPVEWQTVEQNVTQRPVTGSAFEVGAMRVRLLELTHPGGCVGVRIDCGSASVAFLTDHELDLDCTEAASGRRVAPETLCARLRGVDTLVADGQYTDDEYVDRVGWGHPRATTLVDLADQIGARRLVITHHDPDQTDAEVAAKRDACLARAGAIGASLSIQAAHDGLRLTWETDP